jgi:hypothetical protein
MFHGGDFGEITGFGYILGYKGKKRDIYPYVRCLYPKTHHFVRGEVGFPLTFVTFNLYPISDFM